MTIINEKKNQLEILYNTTAPSENLGYVQRALCAAVRWYGTLSESEKNEAEDGQNLVILSELINTTINTKTILE